jgi:hypothetical protein
LFLEVGMMQYEKPELELILFGSDVIATSEPKRGRDEDELPIVHGIEEPFE